MDVHGTMSRAKSLISVFKELTNKHDGDKAKAAGEMDKDLGKMWRQIVDKSGLEFELPKGKPSCDKEQKFYKRVKRKMHDLNLPGEAFNEPTPYEETKENHKSLKDKVQILIVKK